MTKEEFRNLQPGDLVHHASGSDAYVVTANYGSHVTAVKTADLTNPEEWVLRHKQQRVFETEDGPIKQGFVSPAFVEAISSTNTSKYSLTSVLFASHEEAKKHLEGRCKSFSWPAMNKEGEVIWYKVFESY